MGIDDVMTKEVSLGIQAYNLTAGTETGVYRHYAFLTNRRSQKKLPEVLPEHLHGLFIGLFLGLVEDFRGD